MEGRGAGMHSREWLAVGLGWGRHLCAGVQFQECVGRGGLEDAGCQGQCQEFWVQGSCPGNLEGCWGICVC